MHILLCTYMIGLDTVLQVLLLGVLHPNKCQTLCTAAVDTLLPPANY